MKGEILKLKKGRTKHEKLKVTLAPHGPIF
jgi:hypothetical protein